MTKKKATKKVAKKKTVVRSSREPRDQPKTKKKVTKKKAKKKVARKRPQKLPTGYKTNQGGIVVPENIAIDTVIEPAKITSGLKRARQQIKDMMEALSELTEEFDVSGISLSVSFSADGKFLGVGVGGATSIQISLTPTQEDE